MESWRVSPLPPGWRTLRLQILERDGYQCTRTRRDGSRCPARATDVDHTNGPDDHRPEVLRSLCGWCHRHVTSKQANEARNMKGRGTERPRSRRHPGLVE